MSATHADLVACVERELRLRVRVYPRWVLAKRLSQEKAAAEIRLMETLPRNPTGKVLRRELKKLV